jgi:hypothetical protein
VKSFLFGDRAERDDVTYSGGSAPDFRFGLQPVLQFLPAFTAARLVEFIGEANLLFKCVYGHRLSINLGFDPTTHMQPLGAALRFVEFGSFLCHANSVAWTDEIGCASSCVGAADLGPHLVG